MKSATSKFSALLAFAAFGITACGSDSTGPSNLDSVSALQSLALGMQQLGGYGSTTALETNASLTAIAPFLNQVTVNINGSTQNMFALALHESFPAGTCEETIFADVVPADPGACTPPPLGLVVILWQSHSASERPDRMAFLVGDVGTTDFSFDLDSPTLPGVALYTEGENNMWVSESGTLTSAVTATAQSCNIPLPPYAKSGACNIATFDEQGSIVLTAFDIVSGNSSGGTKTLILPRQTLRGLWMAISEVQPIGLTATRSVPPSVIERLFSTPLRSAAALSKTKVGRTDSAVRSLR